jgi:repressor LexA
MAQLTIRQKEVLDFIRQEQGRTGYSPSSREIQAHFGFSSQTAAMNHLRALEKKRFIVRTPGKARSAVDSNFRRQRLVKMVPVVGNIPAGIPVESAEQAETELGIDPGAFGAVSRDKVFALIVRGDSMIGAQIADGDTVILKKSDPRNRDIVAALIDGESTLKRYVVEGGVHYLRAENPDFPDLLPASELEVQGVMIGLLRKVK